MSIDYQIHICDLARYELLYSTKFESEDAHWVAVYDFHEKDCIEWSSIIEGVFWGNINFGYAHSEIYSGVRKLLSSDQRTGFDRFFGAINEQCQLNSDGWFDETMRIIDIPRKNCFETVIAAMSCGSVRELHAVWEQLDLQEYLTATTSCVNGDEKLKPILDHYFESSHEYRNYIAGWGELIDFALQSNKGLVIQIAI